MTKEEQQAHRDLLVADLRSGKFTQTHGTLRRLVDGEYRHCCLGVACERFLQETGRGSWESYTDRHDGPNPAQYFELGNGELGTGILPPTVAGWYGLDTAGAYGGGGAALAADNDRGESFDRIADIIETEPSLIRPLKEASRDEVDRAHS